MSAPAARTVIIEDRGSLAFLFLNNNLHVGPPHMHPQAALGTACRGSISTTAKSYLARNAGYSSAATPRSFAATLLRAKDPVPHPSLPASLGARAKNRLQGGALGGRRACRERMLLWIPATIFAAFNAGTRGFLLAAGISRSPTLSTMGATWARFAFAMPLRAWRRFGDLDRG